MKNISLIALIATGALALTSQTTTAADLATSIGSSCCSDMEERIAELEATTVKKGNRKMSLTISGWVAQQVTFWDDGVESNAYVSDIGTTLASHIRLSGTAQIQPGLSAGYVLQLESIGNEPLAVNQSADTAGRGVGVLQSFWFLKSDTLGKLSVGTQSSAADNAAILVDASGSLVPANYVLFDNNNFALRFAKVDGVTIAGKPRGAAPYTWGALASCGTLAGSARNLGASADCDGVPNNNIRYDTPVMAGFSGSASWGEDDVWAVAGRYAGEFNSIKLAAAIAFTQSTDDNGAADLKADGGLKASALQAGLYIQHTPTGLFAYGAYGKDYNDRVGEGALRPLIGEKKDGDSFYLKGGVRARWNSLGHTIVYGEYGENNDKQSTDLYFTQLMVGSQLTQWGGGIVQEIDSASMTVWLTYRHFDAELTQDNRPFGGALSKFEFEPLELVKVGALINF